ncbi:hypothetical protein [Nocardia xishanensis]
MIEFNVTPTRTPHGHLEAESLLERTSKWWTCSDEKLSQFGDVAFAVQANTVAGVYRITGWRRDDVTGKVELFLEDLPESHPGKGWLDHPAPVPWEPGQRQPFKYVSRKGLLPAPPTDVVRVNGRRIIAGMALAATRNLGRIPHDLRPAFKVVRAHEIYRVVFSLLETGTPLPGGPRLLPRVDWFPHEFTVFERELARLARGASIDGKVPAPDAKYIVQLVDDVLERLARFLAQPPDSADGTEHHVSKATSEVRSLGNRYQHSLRDSRIGSAPEVLADELHEWAESNVHNYPTLRSFSEATKDQAREISYRLRIGISETGLERLMGSTVRRVWDRRLT